MKVEETIKDKDGNSYLLTLAYYGYNKDTLTLDVMKREKRKKTWLRMTGYIRYPYGATQQEIEERNQAYREEVFKTLDDIKPGIIDDLKAKLLDKIGSNTIRLYSEI